MKQTVGIIGFGQFGRLVASVVGGKAVLKVYDTVAQSGVSLTSLEEAVRADIVVLAIPLESYREVLSRIAPHIQPQTLLIDACSVKTVPEDLIAEYLPDHQQLLLTHPFFGPRSAEAGITGHTLVVTKAKGAKATRALRYCKESLGLSVVQMSGDAHDKLMAQLHAATFFVGRGLRLCDFPASSLTIPSFEPIQKLIELDQSESDALYHTIQIGNPYAKEIRQKIIASLQAADAALYH